MSEPNSDSASELLHIKTTAAAVAQAHLAPRAAEIDREGRWPHENFQALAQAGLLGLTVPRQFGGLGQGFTGLVTVVQELARACSSTALCYGMHCVASKVLSVCPTPGQAHRYLEPIARGEHVTTLALSEPGTGVHFYLPRVSFHPENNVFVVNGTKTFVSNGGHADSYVISVVAEGAEYDPGTFSTLVVDADAAGVEWQESWEGLGMRGNASRGVRLRDVRVPSANLLGREGDETWHLFEVVAPYFQAAMAAVYAGIASAAVNLTASHLRERRYAHTERPLGETELLTHRLGELWIAADSAWAYVLHAARLGDLQGLQARSSLMACKSRAVEAAVHVTNEALTLAGGRAFAADHPLSRLLRDARAGHVMAPSTDLLKHWIGRLSLDLPLL